jgi:hypothetical protein
MKGVAARLIALFFGGVLLLNFPVLAIFNRPTIVAGIPLLYLYLFFVWLCAIAAVIALAWAAWDEEE